MGSFSDIWEAINGSLPLLLLSVFLLTLFGQFWSSFYSYSFNHDRFLIQAFLGLLEPLIHFPGAVMFIEHKDLRTRFLICCASGLAGSIGSSLMLLVAA